MTTHAQTFQSNFATCTHTRSLPVYRSEHSTTPAGREPDVQRPIDRRASPSLQINVLLAVALAAVIVLLFVGIGGGAAANAPFHPASPESTVTDTIEIYVVQPGDTLWSIAANISPDGADLRPAIDHLSDMAGGSLLDVGQRITIDHAAIGG